MWGLLTLLERRRSGAGKSMPAVPNPLAHGSRSRSYLVAVVAVGLTVTLLVGLASPWLPSERIEMVDGSTLVGYVVEESAIELVVLRERDRQVVRVRVDAVADRVFCDDPAGRSCSRSSAVAPATPTASEANAPVTRRSAEAIRAGQLDRGLGRRRAARALRPQPAGRGGGGRRRRATDRPPVGLPVLGAGRRWRRSGPAAQRRKASTPTAGDGSGGGRPPGAQGTTTAPVLSAAAR